MGKMSDEACGAIADAAAINLTRSGAAYASRSLFRAESGGFVRATARMTPPPRTRVTPSDPTSTNAGHSSPWMSAGACACAAATASITSSPIRSATFCGTPPLPAAATSAVSVTPR